MVFIYPCFENETYMLLAKQMRTLINTTENKFHTDCTVVTFSFLIHYTI